MDGPCQSSLDYYKEKYDVDDNFIVDHTMEVTDKNIDIMLNDRKHPFGPLRGEGSPRGYPRRLGRRVGHGYCLAMALLNMEIDRV